MSCKISRQSTVLITIINHRLKVLLFQAKKTCTTAITKRQLICSSIETRLWYTTRCWKKKLKTEEKHRVANILRNFGVAYIFQGKEFVKKPELVAMKAVHSFHQIIPHQYLLTNWMSYTVSIKVPTRFLKGVASTKFVMNNNSSFYKIKCYQIWGSHVPKYHEAC